MEASIALYEEAMAAGVCAEQARLFLPAYGMYVRWVWTASLQAVAHFLRLRLDEHAQKEIRDYAEAIKQLTAEKFPISPPSTTGKPAVIEAATKAASILRSLAQTLR